MSIWNENDIANVKEYAREEGLAEGRAEGKAEGKAEAALGIAKNLLASGMEIEEVCRISGVNADHLSSP